MHWSDVDMLCKDYGLPKVVRWEHVANGPDILGSRVKGMWLDMSGLAVLFENDTGDKSVL